MYCGCMTKELEMLYEAYEKKFGHWVGGYMDLEYGPEDYEDYIKDIKRAIATNHELPDVID